jgi:hypothetical protein
MKNSPSSLALLVLILLAIAVSTTRATITTYTDRATFIAALGGMPTITETYDVARSFVVGDNLYNGVNYRVTGSTAGGNGISGGVLNGDEFTNTSMAYVFQLPIFALGADFSGARTSSGINWVINGIVTPIFSVSPGTGFFGVISTDPFALVDVTTTPSPNEIYSLDNFTYSLAVPEPSTLAFLALSAASLGGAFVRRARRTSH